MNKNIIIIIIIAIFVIGIITARLIVPRGEETTKTIQIKNGQVFDGGDIHQENSKNTSKENGSILTKEIKITDGVRHSVPLDEIRGGGPPRDGIPSIDNPKFINIQEAKDFLNDKEPGISVSLNGIDRFYPFQILVWHEIVNDKFKKDRVLVTYCPLCLSGIVFDPVVNGERVEFGTSGKLWNSNLVMYDRKTESLWSQILGEAIVGEMTGSELAVLPSDQMRFGEWRVKFPNGQVLSRDTGATRFYGKDPYGDYYTTPGTIFPVVARDDRLKDKDFVLGIVIEGQAKAYLPEAVKKAGVVEDEFAGKTIIARYESDLDAVRLFEKKKDGALERINPFPNFWFSWAAAHPETQLYK